MGISIHSATQAETYRRQLCRTSALFQSTPPHRRRRSSRIPHRRRQQFQSTPPHRRRPGGHPLSSPAIPISIHSATQAETFSDLRGVQSHLDFNPLRHTGGDQIPDGLCQSAYQFQSTPPHRRRQGGYSDLCSGQDFNPLRHTGGDA